MARNCKFCFSCWVLHPEPHTQPSLCAMLQSFINKKLSNAWTKSTMTACTRRTLPVRLSKKSRSHDFLAWARATRTDTVPPQPYRVHKVWALVVHYASVAADDFYGQWVTANTPARSPADWAHSDSDRVPRKYRYFMLARRLAPDVWDSDVMTQKFKGRCKNLTFSARKSYSA